LSTIGVEIGKGKAATSEFENQNLPLAVMGCKVGKHRDI
jgi:hypothetical protein